MPGSQPTRRSQAPTPQGPVLWLRRADQVVAATVLAVSLAAIGGYWVWQGRLAGRLIEIDRAEPIAVELKIDINSADWPELCLMPGIGEQMAKRIVDFRQENGPFRDLEGLRRVRGIGPKTFELMKPYLVPLPSLETTAGGENSSSLGSGTVN